MLQMRERIASCSELATQTAENARTTAKTWYDGKARTRHFDAGDFVLVLLPVSGKELQGLVSGSPQSYPETQLIDRLSTCSREFVLT